MRNTLKKTLSLALALMMVVSCIAILPAAADEGSTASGSSAGITENSQGTTLWSATFDEEGLTADTLLDKYGTRFIKGTNGTTTSGITIVGGKLKLDANVYAVVPEISKSGSTVTWNDKGSNNEDFYNLFSGNYYDEDGNLLTSYYFDFDYAHDFNRSYIKPNTNQKTYTYKDSDGKTVNYTVYSKGAGESLFTVLSTGSYTWIMKVSQDGYVYTSHGATTATFDPAVTTNDWEHFTVTKTVDGTAEYTKKVLSASEWEAIQGEFSANGGTLTDKLSVDNSVNYTNEKIYKLEEGTTYNFRYTFDVDPDTKKVSVKVYVKPKDCDGSAWQQVGDTVTYTANSNCLRPTDSETTTTTASNDPCIRIKEGYTTIYLDNMGFYTWSDSECTESSHRFLVGTAATLSSDGKTASSLGVCQKCGDAYKLYGDTTTDKELVTVNSENFDTSKNLTSDSSTPTPSNGKMALTKTDFRVRNAISEPTPDFWFEFDTTITALRTATDANTFVAYMKKSADYAGKMLRYVTASDIYVRTSSADTYTEKLMTLEKDVHYVFKFHITPSANHFDVYVYTVDESGNETLTASSTNGYINFTVTASTDADKGYPAFRIGIFDSSAEITEVKQYTNEVTATLDKAEKIIDSTGFTTSLTSLKALGLKTLSDGTTVYGNHDVTSSSDVRFYSYTDKDNNITTKPSLISFDFMVDDFGMFNSSGDTEKHWNVLGFVAPDNKCYYGFLRLGGVDTDGDGTFDEIFFTNDTLGREKRLYELTPGEWVRITASVDPQGKTIHVYINEQLVVSTPIIAKEFSSVGINSPQNSYIRIGDAFLSYMYKWNVKNVSIKNTTASENMTAWTNLSDVVWKSSLNKSLESGELGNATIRFGNYFYADLTGEASDNGYTILGSRFLTDESGETQNSATDLGGTRLDVIVSDKDTDGNSVHLLEGKKYAITSTIAFNKDAKWNKKVTTTAEDGSTATTTAEGGASEVTVFRLSKYKDANSVRLVYDSPSIGFRAETVINGTKHQVQLYDASGNSITAWTTITNGEPAKWTEATVVVDEANNTFSVYVDGAVAYYKNGDKLVQAVDLAMAVTDNGSFNKDAKYADLTEGQNNAATDATGRQFIRLFQGVTEVYVKEASISLIKDSDVTLIGTQARGVSTADNTFDLRFVFGVDDIYVNSLKYEVSVSMNGTTSDAITVSSKEVYSSIVNGDSTLRSIDCKEGNYLSVLVISGIEKADVENQTVTFTITTNSTTYQVLVNFSGTDVTITYGE